MNKGLKKNWIFIYFACDVTPVIFSLFRDETKNGEIYGRLQFEYIDSDRATQEFHRMVGTNEGTILNLSRGQKMFVAKGEFHDRFVNGFRQFDEDGILNLRTVIISSGNKQPVIDLFDNLSTDPEERQIIKQNCAF